MTTITFTPIDKQPRSSVPDFKSAYVEIEGIIRENSRTFYLATGLLPEDQRRAIRILYSFCRKTDDLVDKEDATMSDLVNWQNQVSRPSIEQTDPVLVCWGEIRQKYGVDRRYESELIEGMKMDLNARQYASWPEVADYCYHVASTVGLLSMPIIGMAPGFTFDQAVPYAIKLGIALQLTNILRDVGEDAHKGRVYFPAEDLAQFRLTREDILQGVNDQRFIALMRFEIDRARRLYHEALPGIAMLSASARPAVGAAALLYQAILDEIEKINYQVYTRRAHTSGLRKLLMLPGIMSKVVRLKAVVS